jgi:DNA-binding NtrC family response regulator
MARILLVDDDELVRATLVAMLQSAGHQTDEAVTVVSGLNQLADVAYDLVITDIVMPDKNGFDLMLNVKQRFPALHVLAITGGGDNGVVLSTAEYLGASATLRKPLESEEFLDVVELLVG